MNDFPERFSRSFTSPSAVFQILHFIFQILKKSDETEVCAAFIHSWQIFYTPSRLPGETGEVL